ncbi:MAG TPA: penicillin-binding transpeptidase domain-containing protein, partial [Tepidisphaeraceae bacterium]|nr:penicillin-binding transpeptidase domain-containing protein [Tepidisphaeraceae bacterium]
PWQYEAAAAIVPPKYLEPTRGRILDCRGRIIAEDAPCSDVCVAYPAILDQFNQPWERKWLRDQAIDRLHRRLGGSRFSRSQISEEEDQIRSDIDAMWPVLAKAGGETLNDIDQARQSIIQEIQIRQRYLWHLNYELANRKSQDDTASWFARWFGGQSAEAIDRFDMVIAAQIEPHAILRNVDANICNDLAKHADEYPGLVVRKSTVRYYPYGDAAAHVIGHLASVNKNDLKTNDSLGSDDLKRYWLNDQIGRTGIEALAEQTLRGTRGEIIPASGDQPEKTIPAIPGRDVTTTIDIELEKQIENLFHHVELTQSGPGEPYETTTADMNGAAVVIDVATGQVRAMVSNPTYDLNHFAQEYSSLAQEQYRQPYLNRATQMALEPGSTVKPMVGIGAITCGVDSITDTVTCDGYLQLHGHKYMNIARCWIAKLHMPHHVIALGEHRVAVDNLTFEDAIEQSCNVYFETMADRLGMDRLAHYYGVFGLGRPTGVGIEETAGRIPSVAATPRASLQAITWFCGIGQTEVLATPIQMCNVAATVARNGIWSRPHLLASDPNLEGAVDLQVSAAAVAAARAGMTRVVNSPTGTGRQARLSDILIAGKTGTAQAAKFTIPRRDSAGNIVRDANGKIVYDIIEPSTFDHINPQAPWYWAWGSDKEISHAWFIGFAPASHPVLAIAVMVEYGGGGGATAGRLAA